MDFQPPNLFIRGVSLGALITLLHPMTVYKYLTRIFHQRVIENPREAVNLRVPMYVTTYRYYMPLEALRALSLPGPSPSHVLEIDLPPGAELQGPAFVEPLSLTQIRGLPREHRYGNGIECLLLTPVSPDWELRVVPLQTEATGS